MAQPKRTLTHDPSSAYEADFYLWCFEQAEHLRQRRYGNVDLPNVIEELESMGREQRYKLESSYRLILAHLLKWEHQPQLRSSSWEVTIVRERANVERRERDAPSLRASARRVVEDVYPVARKEAQIETGLPLSTFPPDCPYTLDQIRDADWLPRAAAGCRARGKTQRAEPAPSPLEIPREVGCFGGHRTPESVAPQGRRS